MRINWVGVRNAAIIAGLAALVLVWQEGFGDIAGAANLILVILFVAAIIGFGYTYFRQNTLAWLVLKTWQRVLIIACAAGIVVLILAGFPLLSPYITPLGVIALIAVLVLIIVWVIRESRRFR
jgi:hypothetical protein